VCAAVIEKECTLKLRVGSKFVVALATVLMLSGFAGYVPAEAQQGTACPIGEETSPIGACAPCADLEGCYGSSAEMQHFADRVIPTIIQYQNWVYVNLPPVEAWMYVNAGDTGTSACRELDGTASAYNDMSFYYCGMDKKVYLGQEALWRYYTNAGDAGAAVGIAHEWGHHVQQVAGIYATTDMSSQERQVFTINKENQADCISGAWLQYMISQGLVNADDYTDIDSMIAIIASLENDAGRDHGTIKERTEWFIHGMNGGMYACNATFPNTPVIT
jgi:hypothetical protein